MKTWKFGEAVRITYKGSSTNGRVYLASPNGVSLVLEFDVMLGGYLGKMPVLYDENRDEFLCLFEHEPVKLEEPYS